MIRNDHDGRAMVLWHAADEREVFIGQSITTREGKAGKITGGRAPGPFLRDGSVTLRLEDETWWTYSARYLGLEWRYVDQAPVQT